MSRRGGTFVPVAGLTIFAIASGYLMSLIPLITNEFKLSQDLVSWLASSYYCGLLLGSLLIEPIVARIGHRIAFIGFVALLALTVITMPLLPSQQVWLFARFIAGIAVAGIFVVIESWLLIGDKKERAKRLGFYMTSLYGGTTLGQFGISTVGTSGFEPFIAILALLCCAMLPPLLFKQGQPALSHPQSMSLGQISQLRKPALIGCLVSGILMGSIYGLMPLSLQQSGISNDKISLLMAAIILGGMLIQPVISWLSTRVSKSLLMAMASLVGVFAMGIIHFDNSFNIMLAMLALLGMSAFALYPIAITLACDDLDSSFIVAATQVMLFSYSLGSATGPLVADKFMKTEDGLTAFFFVIYLATAIYMLIASAKRKPEVLAS
ncbi:MFS transporter [Photobacterium jeanii]|uniref:MFS transporter n=1 Tax=Photobacterium jeanii TaxID=858640 RepID=A0A178K3K7_9GAMM|nr:MFS transporter [Photobacterium jeanii]